MKMFIENAGFMLLVLVILWFVLKLFKEQDVSRENNYSKEPVTKVVERSDAKKKKRLPSEYITLWKAKAKELDVSSKDDIKKKIKDIINELGYVPPFIIGINTYNEDERFIVIKDSKMNSFKIGREHDGQREPNVINLTDKRVSREHLLIKKENCGYVIKPITKQTESTFIANNDGELEEMNLEIPMEDNLQIQLGKSVIAGEFKYPTAVTFYMTDQFLNKKDSVTKVKERNNVVDDESDDTLTFTGY